MLRRTTKTETKHTWTGGKLTVEELNDIIEEMNARGIPDDAMVVAFTGYEMGHYYSIEVVVEDA